MISAVITCTAVMALQAVIEPPTAPERRTPQQLAEHFEDLVWQPRPTFGGGPYRYRLHIPKGDHTNRRLPLLVWIHGLSKSGTDNVMQLAELDLVLTDPKDPPPLYILALQRPWDSDWLTPDSKEKRSPLGVLDGLLQHVLETYPVDVDRVYATGLCEGGDACWEYACRHPERFAALAPVAPVGGDPARAALLKDIPVWVFYSSRDLTPSDRAERMVQALHRAGGFACLTKTTDRRARDPHDCWRMAYQQYKVTDWMLAQRRGRIVWWPPGWPWWQGPMWFGVGTVLLVGWFVDRRRRNLKRRKAAISRSEALNPNQAQMVPMTE